MSKIWFTSDLHLCQKNIIRDLSNWSHANPDSLRDFKDQYVMSQHIIDKINEYVDKKDHLYILGDLYFGKDVKELMTYLRQITCKNLYLTLGNHDYLVTNNLEEFEKIFKFIGHVIELNHRFPLPEADPNRDPWKGRQMIVMCHYAMRVWNKSHHGSWMLYGHSHSSLDNLASQKSEAIPINDFYLQHPTMDVGVDNINRLFGEYRPISFDELQKHFRKKRVLTIDHHEKTF